MRNTHRTDLCRSWLVGVLLGTLVLGGCQSHTSSSTLLPQLPETEASLTASASGPPESSATPQGAAAEAVATETAAVPSSTAPSESSTLPSNLPESAGASATVEASWAQAQRAAQDGDYATAASLLEGILPQVDEGQRTPVTLALARVYADDGRGDDAVALLAALLAEELPAAEAAEAWGLLATLYESQKSWNDAVEAYEHYLSLEPAAEPEVRWHMALAYVAMEDRQGAVQQLELIPLDSVTTAQQAEILEKMGDLQGEMLAFDSALATYDRILAFARYADYRALIQQKRGLVLRSAGRDDEAAQVLLAVVQESPSAYAAYMALGVLDEMQVTGVSDLLRGEVLYYAGQHEDAEQALQAALPSATGSDAARVHYFLGLNAEELEQYAAAFAEYDTVIDDYAQDALVPAAWMAKARAAAANGGDPSGIYAEFARLHPEDARAPEALWLAAVALERSREWVQARDFYHRLVEGYPQDSRAPEAAFREALAAYAVGDAPAALELWSASLEATTDNEARTRLLTWLGLASAAAGDQAAAQDYWQQAETLAPTSYYGLRAHDLSAGSALQLPSEPLAQLPDEDLSEAEWEALADWVERWAPESTGVDLAQEPLAQRAAALWRLGWRSEATTLYQQVRVQFKDDPRVQLALAQSCEEEGAYSAALSAAERLRALAVQAGQTDLPKALIRLIYPTTFAHLVLAESQTQGLDPLLFLALMRQESRFDPWAVSYAGATGLAQVMPTTGEWIASQLGESYHTGLLTRPVVSVRYGVWYLAQALKQFGGDWVAALAAYNAGPGAVQRWIGGQTISDLDLFYETIPVTQTQDYIRLIYEQYRNYQSLYAASQS